jgi:hypothetical protein
MGDNFLWLADIQMNSNSALYVDSVHYTGDFSKEIAWMIARSMIKRRLIDPRFE